MYIKCSKYIKNSNVKSMSRPKKISNKSRIKKAKYNEDIKNSKYIKDGKNVDDSIKKIANKWIASTSNISRTVNTSMIKYI